MSENKTRSSTIALLGIPNTGKSTLVNELIGEKLAAVHRKPQMTRKNFLGLLTENQTQLIFVDTPGFHDTPKLFNQVMIQQLKQGLQDADTVLVLLDVTKSLEDQVLQYAKKFQDQAKLIYVLNKMDTPEESWGFDVEQFENEAEFPVFKISALKRTGIDELKHFLLDKALEGPFYYDPDDLTTATTREIASNFILEKIMEYMHDEIPYETAVVIERFEDLPKRAKVNAQIIVSSESQKRMLIGQQGKNIKRIREAAEKDLSNLIGKYVTMTLFAKVDPKWLKSQDKIKDYYSMNKSG